MYCTQGLTIISSDSNIPIIFTLSCCFQMHYVAITNQLKILMNKSCLEKLLQRKSTTHKIIQKGAGRRINAQFGQLFKGIIWTFLSINPQACRTLYYSSLLSQSQYVSTFLWAHKKQFSSTMLVAVLIAISKD